MEITATNTGAAFTTTHLEQAIEKIPLTTGYCIDNSGAGPGVEMTARRRTCGVPETTSVHERFTFQNGLIVPRTLSVSHQGNGQISYALFGTNPDGATPSLVHANTSALTTAAAADPSRWALNLLQVAGTVLTGVRSMDIDFNFSVSLDGADSDTEPSTAGIDLIEPRIVFRGIDVVNWFGTSSPLAGLTCTHANTFVYLKDRTSATINPDHIKLSFAGIAHTETVFDATGQGTAQTDLIIETNWDGTDDPIVTTTDFVIP